MSLCPMFLYQGSGASFYSFDEKSVPGYIFAQLLAGRLYLGSNPPRTKEEFKLLRTGGNLRRRP